ncbi:hypothetical protein ACV7JQ_09005 [Globicatella sulfidifaciens]
MFTVGLEIIETTMEQTTGISASDYADILKTIMERQEANFNTYLMVLSTILVLFGFFQWRFAEKESENIKREVLNKSKELDNVIKNQVEELQKKISDINHEINKGVDLQISTNNSLLNNYLISEDISGVYYTIESFLHILNTKKKLEENLEMDCFTGAILGFEWFENEIMDSNNDIKDYLVYLEGITKYYESLKRLSSELENENGIFLKEYFNIADKNYYDFKVFVINHTDVPEKIKEKYRI